MDETTYPFGRSFAGSHTKGFNADTIFSLPDCKVETNNTIMDTFYVHVISSDAGKLNMTSAERAAASLRNAKSAMQMAIKTGAINQNGIEAIDQAEALMQMVLDNLQKQAVPAEVSHRLANVVNELCACEKLCNGEIKAAVYDLSVATERLRDRIA